MSTKLSKNIKYDKEKEKDFQNTLKQRVEAYFKNNNISKKGNFYMWFKVIFLLSSYWALWYTLAFHKFNFITSSLLIITFIITTITLAFTVAHDAVHNTISKNTKINDLIYWFSFNMLGPNAYLWRIRHNNAHHFCVNIPGSDVDIEGSEAMRFAPHIKWKPIHKFQHFFAPILYSIFILHWIFIKDFDLYQRKEFGNVSNLNHPWWRFLELVLLKLIYITYMLVIPILYSGHSIGTVIIAFFIFQFILSFFVTMSFVSSHLGNVSLFVFHDENHKLPHSFYEHQLHTSIDFHPISSIASFFFGGFNAHVAHHMFPDICSVHYPELTKIIKRTTKEFNLPYHEMPIHKLYYSHFQLLERMGRNPVAGNQHMLNPDSAKHHV